MKKNVFYVLFFCFLGFTHVKASSKKTPPSSKPESQKSHHLLEGPKSISPEELSFRINPAARLLYPAVHKRISPAATQETLRETSSQQTRHPATQQKNFASKKTDKKSYVQAPKEIHFPKQNKPAQRIKPSRPQDQNISIITQKPPFQGAKKTSPPHSPRAITPAEEQTMEIAAAAFGGPDYFFVGPDNKGSYTHTPEAEMNQDDTLIPQPPVEKYSYGAKDEKSLSKVKIHTNEETGKREIIFEDVVSQDAMVNNQEVDKSPLNEQSIAHIALAGENKLPVIVKQGDLGYDEEEEEEEDPRGADAFLIINKDRILKNEKEKIRDANNFPINQQIVAIAATQ